ncbi:hypothetical protein [Polynucleobacter sp. MWH-Braz-FAM2G]|uniref:hypothetical protein n=1 Tax=Polynucleobacter sp. MWH-Braz-FAM2G TaxID=1855883 RepID=UPI001BFD7C04|nr:hypothetical protein [Polynucleobacter sp. MWH-Braz-FAM2G]QWD91775.1 hypothetical protein FD973_05535 [Polynucleobacter sp. MWH-Braz-FAM2G]
MKEKLPPPSAFKIKIFSKNKMFRAKTSTLPLSLAILAGMVITYQSLNPTKKFFECKSTFQDEFLIVNEYFGGIKYSLNDYSLKDCISNDLLIECSITNQPTLSFSKLKGDLRKGIRDLPISFYSCREVKPAIN